MSANSLPVYRHADALDRTPSYSYEPQDDEQRIALADRPFERPSGNFIKQSKSGNSSLRLLAQEDDVTLPVYGSGSPVDGVIDLSKPEGVSRVEVQIEGFLKLREIAEGGHSTVRLCLDNRVLWVNDRENQTCPASLRFSLQLPNSFTYDDVVYPLPPTFSVKLSGLPGFTANIDYSVSATINKPNASVPVKSKAFGFIVGTTSISTPILYYPRTRAPSPVPPLLPTDALGFLATSEWALTESVITAKQKGIQNIATKLYVPGSKLYPLSERIPFHLLLSANPVSLAAFLPLSPIANALDKPRPLHLQVMRQSTVDVGNVLKTGAKREMWRVDCIGEAVFRLAGDAPSWIAYSGEITLNESIKTPGFKAAGLTVKDCLLLSLNPPDPLKCPFADLRQVMGIRLTTDTWSQNGAGIGRAFSTHSGSSSS